MDLFCWKPLIILAKRSNLDVRIASEYACLKNYQKNACFFFPFDISVNSIFEKKLITNKTLNDK